VSKLKPMDLAFFVMENQNRPMHMAGFELFELPKKCPDDFVASIVKAFRSGEVAAPFNQKLKWIKDGVASWETVEPDLSFHVRHMAVPQPGTMAQLYEMVSFLNTPLLDRSRPPWDATVIEGIEGNRFAVLVRVHHACIDGLAGMKLFQKSLSTSPRKKTIRAFWSPDDRDTSTRRRRRPDSGKLNALGKRLTELGKLPKTMSTLSGGVASMAAQAVGLRPEGIRMPFRAAHTPFNAAATSSARRYANCELSLPLIKKLAKSSGATVNDVIMTAIDEALHRYLAEQGEPAVAKLTASMAMSLRDKADGPGAGNQVSVALIPMGDSDSTLSGRLAQIQAATRTAKKESQKLPYALLQAYTLVVAGGMAAAEIHPALGRMPNANVLISNMIGPDRQLYLAGARLCGFHGLPILPPGMGLNITFVSIADSICLGIGAAPEAVASPYRVIELVEESLQELAESLGMG